MHSKFISLLLFAIPLVAVNSNYIIAYSNTGSTQTARVLSIPRIFTKGEIAHYPQPRISGTPLTTWQADVKNHWSDGTVKFAIISFPADVLVAGTTVDFVDNVASSSSGSGLTEAQMLTFNSSNWNIGVDYTYSATTHTVDARTMISDDITASKTCGGAGSRCKYWLNGPVVTQVILEGPLDDTTHARDYEVGFDQGHGVNNPIRTKFYVTFITGLAAVQESVYSSIDWADRLEDQTYDVNVNTGPTLATNKYTQVGVFHNATTGWHKTYWDGTAPDEVIIDYNVAYLIASNSIPHYEFTGSVDVTYVNNQINAWNTSDQGTTIGGRELSPCPAKDAMVQLHLPGTGDRQDIGWMPRWVNAYIFSWTNASYRSSVPTLRAMVLGNADVTAHMPMHMREYDNTRLFCGDSCTGGNTTTSAYGRPMSIEARPFWTAGGYGVSWKYWPVNTDLAAPISFLHRTIGPSCPDSTSSSTTTYNAVNGFDLDAEHRPDLNYTALLLSGDPFYFEQLMWDGMYLAGEDTYARKYNGHWDRWGAWNPLVQANRAFAWGIRTLGNALFMSLDNSPEQQYFQRRIDNTAAIMEGSLNLTSGNFPPANSSCPGYNANTTNDKWCAGNITVQIAPNTARIMPMWSNNKATGHAWVNPNWAELSPWQMFFIDVVLEHMTQVGITALEPTRQELVRRQLRLYFDPISNPYLMNLYEAPAGPSNGTTLGSWTTSIADLRDNGYVENGASANSACAFPAFHFYTTDWLCPNYNDQHFPNSYVGYAHIARAAVSTWHGITTTASSDGSALSGDAAWAWINDPARKISIQNFAVDPSWDMSPNIPPVIPYLTTKPTDIVRTCTVGGSNPSNGSISVDAVGTILDNYTATKTASWITLTNATGSAPGTVTVAFSCSGLLPGSYSDVIEVTSTTAGILNSQSTNISLTVNTAPTFYIRGGTGTYLRGQ